MARLVVENEAPPEAFKFTVASSVAPSKKLTVPSDPPVGVGLTVAVRNTGLPVYPGLGVTTSAVVVEAGTNPDKATVVDWLEARSSRRRYRGEASGGKRVREDASGHAGVGEIRAWASRFFERV